jgi:lipopolysaccharide export system permease protein
MVVPFLIGQGAVVLMLTGTVLYNNADTFLSYGIPAMGVVKIAVYFMPYLVNLTMPVAIAVAASLAVSRLSRDSEITAMRAAGISLKRVFLPVFMAGLAISLGDFYFGEKVVPWSNLQYERTMNELSRNLKVFVPKERTVVQSLDKQYTAYVGRMELSGSGNKAKLYDVMFWISKTPGLVGGSGASPTMIAADTADYENGHWRLHKAKLHTYTKDGVDEVFLLGIDPVTIDFTIAERSFNSIVMNLPLYSSGSEAATISFRELGERIGRQRASGWLNKRDILEYHFKLSVPFSCLVFAIACPPLSLKFARAGGFMGVLLSIILVFVYWNTLLAAKIIGAKFPDVIPPQVAAGGQNVVFSVIGLYFLWRGE